MMYNYETMMENLNVMKTACTRFRKEMTVMCAMLAKKYGLCSFEDYIRFNNELSDDIFLGNYCTSVTNAESINVYKQVVELNSIDPALDILDIDKDKFYHLLSKES